VPEEPSEAVEVPLRFREPLFPDNLFGHLAATAVPGVEEWRGGAYRCTLRLPGGPGVATLPVPEPGSGVVAARLRLADPRDLPAAVARCRALLDLDADPHAVGAVLWADPVLRPLLDAAPGRRVPGTAHPEEFAVRAVLGQQVSTAAARTHAARLVLACGEQVDDPDGGLTHLFPLPAALAGVDPAVLALPDARRLTVLRLVRALAAGEIELSAGGDVERARRQLSAVPGIGPWTVDTVAMRALGDRDAFVPTDLGVRAAAVALGLPATPAALVRVARAWQPVRAYAVQYLWATGPHAVNRLPP
jgi:AraC family transcriptional regulator, regulatory protein of adaptative response / DNA-3-methyladenine glycosylase II